MCVSNNENPVQFSLWHVYNTHREYPVYLCLWYGFSNIRWTLYIFALCIFITHMESNLCTFVNIKCWYEHLCLRHVCLNIWRNLYIYVYDIYITQIESNVYWSAYAMSITNTDSTRVYCYSNGMFKSNTKNQRVPCAFMDMACLYLTQSPLHIYLPMANL